MAICKDCFHWESCRAMFEAAGGIIVPDDFKGSAVRCKHFVSTADVVPRAEVAKEIFEEIERIIQKNYESAQDNEEDEELEAATDYMSYISYDLEELKKKYTEAEPPKGD